MAEVAARFNWKDKSLEEQAEYFLLKFNGHSDVTRDKVYTLMDQFHQFDSQKTNELGEHDALRLLEARRETKTFMQLLQMVKDIDLPRNRKLCFLEWCCAVFGKSWLELHKPFINEEEIRELAAKQAVAEQEATAKRQELAAREAAKQREEQRRQQETSRAGVVGMAAKFKWVGEDTKDSTKSNEERVRVEAAARKAEREAKRIAEEKKRAEEQSEVEERRRREAYEDEKRKQEAEARAKAEAEAADRAARRAKMAERGSLWNN